MRISGFHINGFGIYHDQGMAELPPGLVVFLGENESGKTTLMEFIRTVLFGFRRQDAHNIYLPQRGGTHGGSLQIVRADGAGFTIQRLGRLATIAAAGQVPVKAEPAEKILGGLDRNTFERIFAIGLDELKGLKLLTEEGVRSRMFSAGAGLGAASIPEAMQFLDKELGNLLSQRGQKQINQMVLKVKATDAKIKELQGLAGAYAENQQRRENLEEQIRQNRGEAESLRRQWRRLEQLEQARQPWVNQKLARERAQELEFARNFPPQGLSRWEALSRELERIHQTQKGREEDARLLLEQLGRLDVDEVLLAQWEAVEALLSERELLVRAQLDYPQVQRGLEQAETAFKRKLKDLGTDWDEERLARVDTSVQVRQRVQEFGRALAAAERESERAQADHRAAQEAVSLSQRQAEAAAQQWRNLPEPPVTDPQALLQKKDAVRLMRHWLHQRDVAAAQLPPKLAAQNDVTDRLASLERQSAERLGSLPGWLWIPGLVMGIALAGWMVYRRSYDPAGFLCALSLGLAIAFFLLHRRQESAERERQGLLQEEIGRVEDTCQRLADEIGDLEQRAGAAENEIEQAGLIVGRGRPGDVTQLEAIAAWLEQAGAQLGEWQAQEREKGRAEDHWRDAQARGEKTRQETASAAQAHTALQDDWKSWVAGRGFQEPVRPEAFEAVLSTVENARSAALSLAEYRQRLDRMKGYLMAVRSRLSQVLEACGRRSGSSEPGLEDLDALRRALGAALASQQERRELEAKQAAISADLAKLKQLEQEKETDREGLRRQAEAAGEEDFHRRAAAFEEWRTYRKRIEESEITLAALAGTREAQEALEAELEITDPLKLQGDKEIVQRRLTELEEAIDRDRHESGTLDNQLAMMAHNEELGQRLLDQRTQQELLNDAVKRWATLAVCRHLLNEARGVYERERQPKVIREADQFLKLMAHGRYRLISSVGEDSIQLEDVRSSDRKEEKSWSAGLADQVYLAIRLGLAREFGRHSEPLPVILDDVLVKFDPRRRRNAARVILDFAREQQVLLFSCHPEFMAIMEEGRQHPRHQGTPVAYYGIADGVINPASPPPFPKIPTP